MFLLITVKILYAYKPPAARALFKHPKKQKGHLPRPKTNAQGHIMYEHWPTNPAKPKELLDFPHLPDQIGSREHWWVMEAWRRYDPRIRWQDIQMRQYRPNRVSTNSMQMHVCRNRKDAYMIAWEKFQGAPEDRVKDIVTERMTPAQLQANSTRGHTPGLIVPALGESPGNRVPWPERIRGAGVRKRRALAKEMRGAMQEGELVRDVEDLTGTSGEPKGEADPSESHESDEDGDWPSEEPESVDLSDYYALIEQSRPKKRSGTQYDNDAELNNSTANRPRQRTHRQVDDPTSESNIEIKNHETQPSHASTNLPIVNPFVPPPRQRSPPRHRHQFQPHSERDRQVSVPQGHPTSNTQIRDPMERFPFSDPRQVADSAYSPNNNFQGFLRQRHYEFGYTGGTTRHDDCEDVLTGLGNLTDAHEIRGPILDSSTYLVNPSSSDHSHSFKSTIRLNNIFHNTTHGYGTRPSSRDVPEAVTTPLQPWTNDTHQSIPSPIGYTSQFSTLSDVPTFNPSLTGPPVPNSSYQTSFAAPGNISFGPPSQQHDLCPSWNTHATPQNDFNLTDPHSHSISNLIYPGQYDDPLNNSDSDFRLSNPAQPSAFVANGFQLPQNNTNHSSTNSINGRSPRFEEFIWTAEDREEARRQREQGR
ncbi:MAG: hypothetical protein Q9166_006912 [cf. Caloplaca sp. 2 TL-2023]